MSFNIFKRKTENPNSAILHGLKKQAIFPISYSESHDIYIASYPKSGVTWLQHALCGIIYGMDVTATPDSLANMLIPDIHYNKYYLRTGETVVFKSHSLPEKRMAKVIHLVRDGRDVMASYFAMQKNLGENITLEEMIMEKKGLFPCDWGKHSLMWLQNPYDAEIIRVSYEEMKTKTIETFAKISQFIGVNISSERIAEVVRQSSFDEMQKKEKKYGWSEGTSLNQGLFVRRGLVGSYKEEISEELVRYFERENEYTLTSLGYYIN